MATGARQGTEAKNRVHHLALAQPRQVHGPVSIVEHRSLAADLGVEYVPLALEATPGAGDTQVESGAACIVNEGAKGIGDLRQQALSVTQVEQRRAVAPGQVRRRQHRRPGRRVNRHGDRRRGKVGKWTIIHWRTATAAV
jgi:hypothetical protein